MNLSKLNPFNFFSRKASATNPIVVNFGRSRAEWRPKTLEKFADEGYQANVTVYACVNEISKAAAGISWQLRRRGVSRRSRVSVIDDHPVLNLMRRPNPFQGGSSFIEAVTAYLLISGNSYIERVGPDNGPPLELYTHRPDRFSVIPDRNNMIAGYKYEINSESILFLDGQILHRKLFSPLDDWYGLSPIQVAARDIDSDNEAAKWNLSLLKNDMRPPGAFITDGDLGDAQFDRLKREINASYQGSANAGRPLFLDGGLDWKNFTISQKDSDWLNGRKLSKREIAQAYQVPPELIGDGEIKTYSNYQEARKSFYLETILPYMDALVGDLNNWLTPLFGDNIALDYDRDDIEALSEDRNKTFERVRAASWLTINEQRVETGFDEIEGGDVMLVPIGMVPLQAAASIDDVEAEE